MKSEIRKDAGVPKGSKPAADVPAPGGSQARAAAPPEPSSKGRMRTGQVVSAKMDKTIVVSVEQRVAHPLYRKIVRRHKKLYAHDEGGAAKTGDWVKIQESRPLSRLKCWRLVQIVRSAAEQGAA